MNQVLLSSNVIAILFVESILVLLAFIAFFWSIRIYKHWNFESLQNSQYLLEKKNYFTTTIIYFILLVKILLLPFFASVVNELSNIVPGAMCGAGVISANDFGFPIFFIKLFVLFLGVCWILTNAIDLKSSYLFTKRKYELFFLIFGLLILEFCFVVLYFSNISLETPVACCSVIYGTSDIGSKIPFNLDGISLSLVFFIVSGLLFVSNQSTSKLLSFFLGVLFLYFGYYFVLHIVGIYIYELPTHICPFCMLQKEYYFIGYPLWIALFLTSFFAMAPLVLNLLTKTENHTKAHTLSTIFNLLLVIISAYYLFSYYFKNGVWL